MTNSFSILIPNYNGAKFIGNTIKHFEAGFPGVSIIVVDDASTDDSIIKLNHSPAYVIRREVNGGFAAAVNTGLRYIAKSKYTYTLVANSDITIDIETCRRIVCALDGVRFKNGVAVLGFLEGSAASYRVDSEISGFIFAMRNDLLESVGFFDESFYMYGEEQDYFRRVIKAGYQIHQTGIRVAHLMEGSAASELRNSWLAMRNSIWLEVKRLDWVDVLKKIAILFLIINRIYRSTDGADPSVRRILRPGIFFGNFFLLGAIFWNIGKYLKAICYEK